METGVSFSAILVTSDKFLSEDSYRIIFWNEISCTWDLKNRVYLKKLWDSKADKSYCVSPNTHQKCFSDTNVPMNHLWIQQKCGSQDTKTYLTNQYVILRYCSPNLCKWNYLYGGLSFFKIQVNYFMAQDKPFGAILNFKTFLSFINRLLVTI